MVSVIGLLLRLGCRVIVLGRRSCFRGGLKSADLVRVPRVKTRNGVAKRGQFYVCIDRMNVAAAAVTHEFLTDVGDYANTGKARIEGVTQVVKAVFGDARSAERTCPPGFDSPERLPFIGEDHP